MNPKSKLYSFCETATAPPLGRWHIRELTKAGPKFTGGADTKSLCGKTVSWDMQVKFGIGHFDSACPKCVKRFLETYPQKQEKE